MKNIKHTSDTHTQAAIFVLSLITKAAQDFPFKTMLQKMYKMITTNNVINITLKLLSTL